jgi:hypothetical protein
MPVKGASFNLFDHPLVFEQPELTDPASAWVEHIPFAMLLIDLARPRLLVELGTHSGVSYCAFCQAVRSLALATRCYAVDTWQGDAHAGSYSSSMLQRLRGHHDVRYSHFSTLVQSTFDQALHQFTDGSIDILHIDGLHSYDAVKHDFENWKPKLSEAGIVLLHDTAETKKDFGVHKLMAELGSNFPSFEFSHGHGLGVVAVGKELPREFEDFLSFARAHTQLVRSAFAALGCRDSLRSVLEALAGQQKTVNEFKRSASLPVEPATEQLNAAIYNPPAYAAYAAKEVRELIQQIKLLQRGQGPPG